MILLELEGVRKEFGHGLAAVDGVSLSVAEGEMVVLVGPSGCGKTTLLRLVAGLEQPSDGTIRLSGEDLTRLDPGRRDVAMVFQNYALYPHKTVYENIAFPLRMRGFSRRERDTMVRRVAGRLGLDSHLGTLPSRLSGGQQQRVALGRALVRQPKVFLFDEPLSNLDAQLRRELRWELRQFQREVGIAAIYVTHDQDEAMALADRLAVMKAGRLFQFGPPIELYRDPAHRVVAELVGSPPMNILDGILTLEEGTLRLMRHAPRISCEITSRLEPVLRHVGRSVSLGFRPDVVRPERRDPDDLQLTAEIVLADRLGEHTEYLLASDGERRLVIRTSDEKMMRERDRVDLFVALSSCYWFSDDGLRIQGARHSETNI